MLLWVPVVHSYLLLSNMSSKPEILSHVIFFFLFHSLPHPKSCQFYFLNLSNLFFAILTAPLNGGLAPWAILAASYLVSLSSLLQLTPPPIKAAQHLTL